MAGSLSKEPPLGKLLSTMRAIQPGMKYSELLELARRTDNNLQADTPGLIKGRFIKVLGSGEIAYGRLLALLQNEAEPSPRLGKILLVLWMYRDDRVRDYILNEITENGRISAARLQDKRRASYFVDRAGFRLSTAKKIRSNIENFFVETNLLNRETNELAIDAPDDDWWVDAAITLSEQAFPADMEQLAADPLGWFHDHGYSPLLAPAATRTNNAVARAAIAEMSEEDNNDLAKANPGQEKTWTAAAHNAYPAIDHDRQPQDYQRDPILLERALRWHYELECELGRSLSNQGITPSYTEHIDMFFRAGDRRDGLVICEIKSATSTNYHKQIRKGVVQLLEYAYIYRESLGPPAAKLMLVQTPPPRGMEWVLGWLESLGITLCWPANGHLITSHTIPGCLRGVIEEP